jgi:glycerol-3-phosphate acyltransferase PlsX
VVIIAHGSSSALAVRNAIRVGIETVENGVNVEIQKALTAISLVDGAEG